MDLQKVSGDEAGGKVVACHAMDKDVRTIAPDRLIDELARAVEVFAYVFARLLAHRHHQVAELFWVHGAEVLAQSDDVRDLEL